MTHIYSILHFTFLCSLISTTTMAALFVRRHNYKLVHHALSLSVFFFFFFNFFHVRSSPPDPPNLRSFYRVTDIKLESGQLSLLAFKVQKLRNGGKQQQFRYKFKVIVLQSFILLTALKDDIFLSVSLQHQVLLLLMSQGTAPAPLVFLFSGTKFHSRIKMASYCITQLPTDCTIMVFSHKRWL